MRCQIFAASLTKIILLSLQIIRNIRLKEVLETLLSEEEEYRDNVPENLQGSERYEKADNACDSIQYAIDNIEDAVSNIEEATE